MSSNALALAPPRAIALPRSGRRRARRSVIPGFGLTMGLTLAWLSLIVLIPLSTVFVRSAGMGWTRFAEAAFAPRALAAYQISFATSLGAAAINAVFGLLTAWVLVRYDFAGRRIVNALVDLPFALPTAVAGIALTAIYASNGWIGGLLAPLGITLAYNPVGIMLAMIFVGLPFIVRSLEPVLEDFNAEVEEAARSLGARPVQVFVRVILPEILPALLTGFALAFARGLGEYGSVIFIAGNMPFKSEIAPLLIVTHLEQYDYAGASAIATVMLLAAFALLLVINLIQAWSRRRMER
ncbi:sulfate ABC transporter permease subunit CysT [Novosphingobium sp. 1949]|uniref:Sulfate transport system permease protein CysT n=1 Tax=Novosphingobium organovorum TaxID=2930092 RepID=A0ABT0BER4_9SPHN|nr:sulfate ABC transporter permease subunit CysT [Novosphingobium organovorum]MCJ2183561.1 sulfate ABC transporter permease subunit CysT [Novosphingobium organovorum]